jgi:hypothetical protein
MLQWKRKILHTGTTLTVVAVGALAAQGVASAHDVAGNDGASTQFSSGTVTALGVDSFTLTTHNGTVETIDTSPTTTFAESGTLIAPTGVSVGQEVAVSLDPSDTTPTAVHVTVLLDRVSGKVLDVTSTSITLSGPRGMTRMVEVSTSTSYSSGKTAATGVTVGEFVTAFGPRDTTTPTELDALFVDIASTSVHPPHGPRLSPSGVDPRWGVPQGDASHTQVTTPVTPAPTPSVTARTSAPSGTPAWSGPPRPAAPVGLGDPGFSGADGHAGYGGHAGHGDPGSSWSSGGGPGGRG